MPVSDRKLRAPLVVHGTIAAVHSDRCTVDVVSDRDSAYLSDVPIATKYVTRKGAGSYVLPEPEDRVLLIQPSDDERWYILGFIDAADRSEAEVDDTGVGPDHRSGRPRMLPGDQVERSAGGGHVVVRRNGVVEIGSGESNKRLYIPLSDLIRDIAQNYNLHTSAGVLRMAADKDPDSDDAVAPTFLQLRVRQYSGEVPVVRLDLGHIASAEGVVLPGETATGAVVYRLTVGEPGERGVADGYGANYEQVISRGGTDRVRARGVVYDVDKTFVVSAGGGLELYSAARVERVAGPLEQSVDGSAAVRIGGAADVVYGSDLKTRVAGTQENHTQGPFRQSASSVERISAGALVERVGGDRVDAIADNHALGVGKSQVVSVGEAWEVLVQNQGQADAGARLQVQYGDLVLRDAFGSIRLSAGGSAESPLSRLVLGADAAVALSWATGQAKLVGKASGEWFVVNAAGLIRLTMDGVVHVGTAGPAGFVLTTLTLPTVYVPAPGPLGTMTAIPTMGAGALAVGGAPRPSSGPPAIIAPGE